MAPTDDVDGDPEQTKSQKYIKKCELCGVGTRTVVKCIKCNFSVHAKCFDIMAKLIILNKSNWVCKQCIQSEPQTSGGIQNENALADFEKQVKQQDRELDILNNLNAELKTVNNLLKIRLCEVDKNYERILNISKISATNTINTYSKEQEMVSTPSFSEVVRKNASAVLVLEAKNERCDINTFKDNVNPVDLGPGITQIKQNNNGKLIVKCLNNDHMNNVKSNLERCVGNNYKISTPARQYPKIIIYEAENNNSSADKLRDDILKVNNLNADAHFKILRKISYKESINIIVEVGHEPFNKIMQLGYLFIGWRKCTVKESFNVVRCFKCSAFGHMANDCKNSEPVCPICALKHKIKDCPRESVKCVNCSTHNDRFKTNWDTNHSSKDRKCLSYMFQIENIKARTIYNE